MLTNLPTIAKTNKNNVECGEEDKTRDAKFTSLA
jgi:hypothetical protein